MYVQCTCMVNSGYSLYLRIILFTDQVGGQSRTIEHLLGQAHPGPMDEQTTTAFVLSRTASKNDLR